jgi:predicted kinase
MAGLPGTGKSSLARLIGARTGAAVLDKDVIKTAALSLVSEDQLAGKLAYETAFALANHLLGQGLAVVIDSPSFYPSVPTHGQHVADERCVPYYFIECTCSDRGELTRRLRERPRLPSNPGLEILEMELETVAPAGAHLLLDTTQPIEECLARALDYLGFVA